MSSTVRDLIRDSFIRSTLRGLGDTPDDLETKDALAMLNEILDVLSQKEEFSTGNSAVVLNVPSKGYVTFSDDPHRVFTATASGGPVRCLCGDSHNLGVGDEIDVKIGGESYSTSVTAVNSYLEFEIPYNSNLSGSYVGTFKLRSEPEDYEIDFITAPPVNMYQVVGSGVGQLQECQEQNFYSAERVGRWWWYDKGKTPYPRLFVSGADRIMAVFPRPTFRNVTLDTDLASMDSSARSALKYRLAAEIAASAGFTAVEQSLMAKYRNAYGTFVRSRHQSASPIPDYSAPGYNNSLYYDIFTDGGGHATF